MFTYIEKLRQKSSRTKKFTAFVVAFTLSGSIFVIWLSVILPDWKANQLKNTQVSNLEPSPLASFSSTVSSGFSAIGDKFSGIKDALSSLTTPSATYYSATTSEPIATTTVDQ